MSATIDLRTVQGNILRGYNRSLVRHFMLEVGDRTAARAFLRAAASGGSDKVPEITSAAPHDDAWVKPVACFNVGLTFEGLRALGVPADSLATFPAEFVEGMAKRALKIGDVGESAPCNWPEPFDNKNAARLHLIASAYADDAQHLDQIQKQIEGSFKVLGTRDGRNLPEKKVFFGYTDSIAQPRFQGISDPKHLGDQQPPDPLGTVLLGHPTRLEGLVFTGPSPHELLGLNGTFNAFRILQQHVAEFEAYLTAAAEELLSLPADAVLTPGDVERIGTAMGRHTMSRKDALREFVAAQMCGRWRDTPGTPVALAPDSPLDADKQPLSDVINFEYDRASRCPAGAHIRRSNPRGGPVVQRIANYTRRLIRRGMSYGPDFDPERPDSAERGLLGNFIGASIAAQFEAVMCDWVNLGLMNPEITGSNDPLIGANMRETSWFELSLRNNASYRLRGIPSFVTTRGGAYTFLPSLPAIAYLGGLES